MPNSQKKPCSLLALTLSTPVYSTARCTITLLTFLFVNCWTGPRAQAQVLYGSLTGNISDTSNAPVPGARIEVANVDTGTTTQQITDVRGVYLITHLQPGTYRITISAPAFTTVVQDNLRLDANSERRLDIQLQLARTNQQIEVKAAAEVIQTDRSDVRSQISSTQISQLPLGLNRNFQTLNQLVPGVQPHKR